MRLQRTLDNFGGHSGGGTPLPIPNREVKPARADGTRRATSRESRSPPNYLRKAAPGGLPSFRRSIAVVQLRDGDLLLRPFVPSDAPAVHLACQDEEIHRFIPRLPDPYGEVDARRYVAGCAQAWRRGERRPFAIVAAESDALLGAIDVRLGETGSIGYWVTPAARGRGVATRALRLLSRWALRQGVERLELTTHPDNLGSQRVAAKAGFVREGVLRSHMRFKEGRRDSVLFSLLPEDLAGEDD